MEIRGGGGRKQTEELSILRLYLTEIKGFHPLFHERTVTTPYGELNACLWQALQLLLFGCLLPVQGSLLLLQAVLVHYRVPGAVEGLAAKSNPSNVFDAPAVLRTLADIEKHVKLLETVNDLDLSGAAPNTLVTFSLPPALLCDVAPPLLLAFLGEPPFNLPLRVCLKTLAPTGGGGDCI